MISSSVKLDGAPTRLRAWPGVGIGASEGGANPPKTSIKFNKDSHDFGNIEQDTENKYSFTFTNTGNEPLKIKNAKVSCGCTVPYYPKEAIMPGKTGQIDVVYKPAKQKGNQSKTVTVSANTNPENTILRISANVNSPDE